MAAICGKEGDVYGTFVVQFFFRFVAEAVIRETNAFLNDFQKGALV